jgi:hypothetical protein
MTQQKQEGPNPIIEEDSERHGLLNVDQTNLVVGR